MKVVFLKFMKNIGFPYHHPCTNIKRTSFVFFFFFTFQFFPIKLDRWIEYRWSMFESVKQPSNRWLLISARHLSLSLSLVITLSLVIAFVEFLLHRMAAISYPEIFPSRYNQTPGIETNPLPLLVRVYTRHYMHQREIWFLGWAREKYNKSSR